MLDPSAEISIRHRQNLIAIDVLDEEDFIDFGLCVLEEALTNFTGFYSLKPGPERAEGGVEFLLLWDLEMGGHEEVKVIRVMLVFLVDGGVNMGDELIFGVRESGAVDDCIPIVPYR